MQVALTGATGFVGSFLTLELQRQGHDITALVRPGSDRRLLEQAGATLVEGSLRDETALRRLVEGAAAVIHAAWDWEAQHSPEANWEVNLTPSFRLLEQCRLAGGVQMLFVSSVAVYGPVIPGHPLDETHPAWPEELYGGSKAMLEDLLMAYHHQFGMNTSSWRPAAVYGIPPLRPLQASWRDFILAVAAGRPVDTDAGGSVVSADDTAHAIVLGIGNPAVAGRNFNLVDTYLYRQTLAEIVREESGSRAPITDRVGGAPPRYRVLSDAARALGARLDRGLDGIREHVRRVLAAG
jgi:nucleoside-diphosphate-sugar epimerase